jgi:hypothetical protein
MRGDDSDICPHCDQLLQIVFVKFRLTSIGMIKACPNCARASTENSGRQKPLGDLFKASLLVLSDINKHVPVRAASSVQSCFWPLSKAATAQHDRRYVLVHPLLAIGLFTAGGYAALVWLANPSTTGKDAVSRPQHAVTILNENVAATGSPAERCMPIGLTARGDLIFPLQCRELRGRRTHPAPAARPELALAVRPEQSARVDHVPQTVGSAHNQNVVNSPSKGSGERSAVDPKPRAKVKTATQGSRVIGENRKRLEDVWLSSRTLSDRRQRFAELINHPLARNCINCLLFGR